MINSQPIKLRRQAASFTQIAAGSEGKLAEFLSGNDAAADAIASPDTGRDAWLSLRDKLRGEANLVIIFGSEIRGKDIASLAKFASACSRRQACLSGRLRQLARRSRHGALS